MNFRLARILKHLWLGLFPVEVHVSNALLLRLKQQVSVSERLHSGEIRIYIDSRLPTRALWRGAPLQHIVRQRALQLFGELRVWDTSSNNGVLIYLLLPERCIEVIADRGINERVGTDVWRSIVVDMAKKFKQGQFEVGLSQAIQVVSDLLVTHFPVHEGDFNPNELPDLPIKR
jgi:uncharacterized membrane protein